MDVDRDQRIYVDKIRYRSNQIAQREEILETEVSGRHAQILKRAL